MSNVKSVFKRASAYKEIFKNSQCLLLISVGQEAHEGERFESTIKLVNDSFGSCIISLYDSLQRHTMALNSVKEPDFFHEISTREGDLWLERNKKYYRQLTIPTKITRWNEWLNHPNFTVQQNKLIELINNDPSYKLVFNNTITNYLAKYRNRLINLSNFNESRARRLCFDYVVEECTVLCLWHELQSQFEVYPSRHNEAMEETRRRFIRPYYPNLLHTVEVGFRNAKQVHPQYFVLLKNIETTVAA